MYLNNLLDLSEKLFLTPEFQQYDETLFRRVASNAYYAIFNLITEDGSRLVFPTLESARVATRSFSHMDMKKAAEKLTSNRLRDPSNVMVDMISLSRQNEIAELSTVFISLQQLRHVADYDFSLSVKRIEVQQALADARRFFETYNRLKTSTPDALKNFIAVLLLRRISKVL